MLEHARDTEEGFAIRTIRLENRSKLHYSSFLPFQICNTHPEKDDSMKSYFLFLAPFEEIRTIAQRVITEESLTDWVVDCGNNVRGVELAKQHIERGARVVVSRGVTYNMLLHENLPVPVVNMGTSSYELLHILVEQPVSGKKVGMICPRLTDFEINLLERCFNCTIIHFPTENTLNVEANVIQCIKEGCNILVGGKGVQAHGARLGIKTISLISGVSTIHNAISRAVEIDSARLREQFRTDQIHAILDFCFDGIIVTDSADTIIMANRTAKEMLGIRHGAVVGKPCRTVCPFVDWDNLDEVGSTNLGSLVKIGNRHVVHTVVPVLTDGKFMGTVMSFQYAMNIEEMESNVRKNLHLSGHLATFRFEDILTVSPAMLHVLEQAKKYASVDSTVLITGQTGTGKEMMAQSIHNASKRKKGPFVAVNCAAIPESLLESELFGYAEGAFTGAKKEGKKGYFELANGGTLFLDEIGEISPKLQSSLLRVLQQKEIIRVGGNKIIPIDARIIAATHQDLEKASRDGKVRSDLFHRLNVLRLSIPSLQERKEDIPVLVKELMRRKSHELSCQPVALSDQAVHLLSQYPWSGNVRELEAVVERLVVLKSGQSVDAEDIGEFFSDKEFSADMPASETPASPMQAAEYRLLADLLAKHGGKKKSMCEELGISATTLWRKLKRYNLL